MMRGFKLLKLEEDNLMNDADFYDSDWDRMVDDGEMDAREAAFMQGWEDAA